jgi:hypothetical protein
VLSRRYAPLSTTLSLSLLSHRALTLAADVIFLIYLYQRWIYPVDPKRVNEFGQGGEDDTPETRPSATAAQSAETKKDK